MFSVLLQFLFLLSSYPLARWVLPHIKTRKNSLILHISIGLIACSLLYRIRVLLALLMIIIGYYLLDKNPAISFPISFLMSISIHILQFYYPVHLKVKNLTKMIFFKIVSTTFNIYDGQRINSKDKEYSYRQKLCHLTKKPTFSEWLAYCLTPFGSLSPSFYEFRLFESILEIGQKGRKVSDKSSQKAVNCLKQSSLHFIIYYAFRHCFKLSFYQSDFFLSFNIFLRVFLVLFLGVIIYSRFFMLWKAVDAGLYESGVFDDQAIQEDEFTSLSLLNLLSKKTIKEYGKAYNHTNGLFWSNYFTSRGPDFGLSEKSVTVISKIIKPMTIGFYGGFFLAPIEKKLFSEAEKVVQIVASLFVTDTFWVSYVFTQVFMVASKSSIRFKTVYAFFYVNFVIYFVFWMAALEIVIVGILVKKQDSSKGECAEKKGDDKDHAKTD